MTVEFTRLEQRMSRIERHNRRLKAFLGIAVICAGAPYLLGAQTTGDVVRASRFEVMKGGQAVAVLSADEDGGKMTVYQNDGKLGGYLRASKIGTSLDLRDKHGNLVGYFDARDTGGAMLCFMNPGSKQCGIELVSTDSTAHHFFMRTGDTITTLVRNGRVEVFKAVRSPGAPGVALLSADARFQLRTEGPSGGVVELAEDFIVLRGRDGSTRSIDTRR